MQTFQPIEYHLTRDFGRKMNVTFEFIKQNWKSLGKSTLMIAGPPVFIASLIMGSFFGDMFSLGLESDPEKTMELFTSATFWMQFLLAMILLVLSSVMSIATINSYILLYEELKTNDIPTAVVWDRVRKTVWTYLGTVIYFFLTFAAFCFVIMIPVGLFSTLSPVVAVLGVWIFMFLIFYLMVSVSLTFIIRAYEGIGFIEALRRSFNLVKGKWWSTFGLICILYFIMMTISYIPIFPLYIIMAVSAVHNISSEPAANPFEGGNLSTVAMILMAVYYMIQLLLSALPNIGIAFQYFNLVEMKEAKGLMSSIETFGESSPQAPTDETY